MAHREGVKEIAELAGNLGSFSGSPSTGASNESPSPTSWSRCAAIWLSKGPLRGGVATGWNAAAEVASIPIVKLVVQPLVENSIEHGIMGDRSGAA
jgi:hypothetical protein